MKWYRAAATALLFMELVASTPSAMAQHERKVPMITMTAHELREIGIALRSAGAGALPNSCASVGANDISVSDEMLAAFRARGFSLESLCLGLSSSFRYDPVTGRPMPFAVVRDQQIPLNLPACFSRAAVFLDCRWSYDYFDGSRSDETRSRLATGREIDAIARGITRTGILHPYANCNKPNNPFNSMCILLDRIVFSSALPLGYGYALAGPEGSDPAVDDVDLNTYRKSSGAPVWSDEKPRQGPQE
jgi:hypothetical protein